MTRRNLQHMSGRTRQKEEFKADIVRAHGGETPVSRAVAETAVHGDIKFFTEACLRPNILRGVRASFLHEAFIAARITSVVIRRRRKENRDSSSLKCAWCIIFRFFPRESGPYMYTRSTKRKSCNALTACIKRVFDSPV